MSGLSYIKFGKDRDQSHKHVLDFPCFVSFRKQSEATVVENRGQISDFSPLWKLRGDGRLDEMSASVFEGQRRLGSNLRFSFGGGGCFARCNIRVVKVKILIWEQFGRRPPCWFWPEVDFNHPAPSMDPNCTQLPNSNKIRQPAAELLKIQQIFAADFFFWGG